MPRLEDLIGKSITLGLVYGAKSVTLHGVETGGLWVEGVELTKVLFGRPKPRKGESDLKTVVFIPYSHVYFVLVP
jgi:hypothetical protein